MALWAKAQQLPPESLNQIKSIYGEHFPIEVRHYLAHFIEEKFFHTNVEIMPDNPQHEAYLSELVNTLIQEIENKASLLGPTEFIPKMSLGEAAKILKQKYSTNPMYLYNYVRGCLYTELKLIKEAGGDYPLFSSDFDIPNASTDVIRKINTLRNRTQETADELSKIKQEQEAFALQYHELTKMNAVIQQLQPVNQSVNQPVNQNNNLQLAAKLREKENFEQMLSQKVARLVQLRMVFTEKLRESYQQLCTLQNQVLDEELIRWKREQQLAGNGMVFNNNNLEAIQEWCESLAELIWLNRQQIKELDILKQRLPLDQPIDVLPQLMSDITQLLSTLVTSTFIIEKQPPQVMKTNTRFTATVRLLVGGKLNVYMTPPQVKVTIISEAQANVLLKNDRLLKGGDSSGEILNNTGTMEYQQATRQLSVSFRNMQLKKIKRAEKKGTESVMDEKFSLLFQSQFNVGGGELTFQVWTLSLPVVVIVHGNQEPHAWATVTWDNAFSEPGRTPFHVPDKVPWHRVAETLTLKYKSATGRSLTEENLSFLAEKALRTPNPDPNLNLTWPQFCKEPLSDRNFTFWEWFYAVMKLTKEHLRQPWTDGSIVGFMRKKEAEEMLSKCPNGTFLLRFSDSELGGITIAWVSESQEIFMLQPFTAKDFQIRSLADRIADLQHLHYLYPDIPKDVAFGKYYTPYHENQPTGSGYVRPLLVTHVPGLNEMGSVSYPNTPQHPFLQSPEHHRDTPSVGSSYPGSVASTAANTSMDYLEPIDEYNLDINLVNLNELMQGYRP